MRMRPGMRANLVAFSIHAFDGLNPFVLLVDLAFVIVVGSYEESSLCTVIGQDIEQMLGIV